MNDIGPADRINVETPDNIRSLQGGFSMKKVITGIAAAAAIAVIGGTTAFALGLGQQGISSSAGAPWNGTSGISGAGAPSVTCEYCREDGHCYTDSDHDGICDYRENGTGICQEGSSRNGNCWGDSRRGDNCRNHTAGRHHSSPHHGMTGYYGTGI